MQPRVIADYACQVGENPLWHPDEQRLYWTDITKGRMYWYEPATGQHQQCYQGATVGGFTFQSDRSLLLFGENGSVRVWQNGEVAETIIKEIPAERGRRFNDVIADPEGRVFCGTISDDGKGGGTLYRLERDGTYTAVVENVAASNGLSFSPDLTKMYFTDSGIDTIWVFQYDRATGALSNRQTFLDLRKNPIKPDGMTVDAGGDVWSAMAQDSCVIRYSPGGVEQQRISFPTKFVSSLTFGGKDLSHLYVTSGCGNDKAGLGETAGALFLLEPGVKGRLEFLSQIGLS